MTMAGLSGFSNGQNGLTQEREFATLAVHAGAPHDPTTGAVIAPVSSQPLALLLGFIAQALTIPTRSPCLLHSPRKVSESR